jgi:hypothetical protein
MRNPAAQLPRLSAAGAPMLADIERAIELCLSRAGALEPAQPERHALVYEVVQLRRLAEIVSSPARTPEPIKSHVVAVSTHDGLSFDDEVLNAVGRAFRSYERWCRRSGSSR